MKAAVCERYGPPEVVVIKDVPMPVVGVIVEAYRLVDTGHKRGSVVITVGTLEHSTS